MPINETDYLLEQIKLRNTQTKVNISRVSINNCNGWYYDNKLGVIRNQSNTFFQIQGIKEIENDQVIQEQPIIIQPEIGYLGIICKQINGEMHYLMQYKIEPGNVNVVQISPTIQATKSNFLQKHGGKKPKYLEYFMNASKYRLIADQIQSEQSSRFLGKRNRNIIIEIGACDDIPVSQSHDWMTIKQIKQLMRYNNLVNMDTRTVLSSLAMYDNNKQVIGGGDYSNRVSIGQTGQNQIVQIYHYINDYKMHHLNEKKLVPLFELNDWQMDAYEFRSSSPHNFKVIFCDIEIEGREVKHWCQPLFEATSIALFGLFVCPGEGERQFLLKCRPEIGCFDEIEIGPTIQMGTFSQIPVNVVEEKFLQKLESKQDVIFDTILSEEGGRFYHEQNRNVVIEIDKSDLQLPDGYFWCSSSVLRYLILINNTLNIQLRNLLSVLE